MKAAQAIAAIACLIGMLPSAARGDTTTLPEGPRALALGVHGEIVVVRSDLDEVLIFSDAADGDAIPARIISGYRTDVIEPRLVGTDAAGDVFVLAHRDDCDAIVEFAPDASGDAYPLAELFGRDTGLCEPVAAMAIAPDGGIYVAHADDDAVEYYTPHADGDVAPTAELAGAAHAALHGVSVLAATKTSLVVVDAREKTDYEVLSSPGGSTTLYPGIHYLPDIRTFAAGASGDASPSTVIDAVVWAVTVAGGSIADVPMDNASPVAEVDVLRSDGSAARAISGDATGLVAPVSLAGDPSGSIVVLDDRCRADSYQMPTAAILVFADDATGDAAPTRTISGPKTGLGCP